MTAPSTPPPANPVNHAPRASAWLGFFLFLVGMGMIYYVFQAANGMLSAPPPEVPTVGTGTNAVQDATYAFGAPVRDLLMRLLILMVMCVVGSFFASSGIKLLFAAWNTKHSDPTP